MYKPLYIEAFKTGLELDKPSFKIQNDAFTVLQDAYIWRERLVRKKGYEKLCRLSKILSGSSLGTTSAGTKSGNIKTYLSLETNMEIAKNSITIHIAAPNAETFTEPATADGTLVGSSGGTGTINYVTGAYTLVAGSGWGAGQAITIDFTYYPGLPCVGIGLRELSTVNAEQSFAFDTKYFYLFSGSSNEFIESGNGTTWKGSNSDFFNTCNYYSSSVGGNIFFVTNFNKSLTPDPISYYNGSFITFAPNVDGIGNKLQQALIIIPYKGRLVALNVYEGTSLATSTQISGRARWCWNGDTLDVNAWRSDIAGKGGYIDAPTSEAIVSAGFVKDTLVVGFERSIFRLRYTANATLPFVWERVSNEFGIESTNSIVKLDQSQIGFALNGIIMCDGSNVSRIDAKIPDLIFDIHNDNEGNKRIHGIRDYDRKIIYWTFPRSDTNGIYPNKILIFNYDNASWGFFKDSITCFGFLQKSNDRTWLDVYDKRWSDCNFAWNSAELQSLYPEIIAGNQHGYIVRMQKISMNDKAFAINAITTGNPGELTIKDHNLSSGDFIYINGIIGTCDFLNDRIFNVNVVDSDQISLSSVFGISIAIPAGSTYFGGGEISWLTDFKARTKSFNLADIGKGLQLGYIDFTLDRTSDGEFNVDVYVDNIETYKVNIDDSFFNTTVSTKLTDYDMISEKIFVYRMFCNSNVRFIQFELNLTNNQRANMDIVSSDIQIHALTLWVEQSGRMAP